MTNRITFIKRWCPTCQCLKDEERWKRRNHFFECLDCYGEIRITWRDRLDDLLEQLEPPIDWLDTKVYEIRRLVRRLRRFWWPFHECDL